MPSNSNTRERPRIEPKTNKGALSAADSLRLHWPEYLMEAGEAGLYLFRMHSCDLVMAPRFASPAIRPKRRCSPDADGLGDGSDDHRYRALTVGQAVRSTSIPLSQSRSIDWEKRRCGMRYSPAPRNCWARWPGWRPPRLCCKVRRLTKRSITPPPYRVFTATPSRWLPSWQSRLP